MSDIDISWKKSKIPGRIGIAVPYNPSFNQELNIAVPSAKFNRADKAWYFDEEARHTVESLLAKYYVNLAWHKVRWTLDGDVPQVDGLPLVNCYRDKWAWKRAFAIRPSVTDVSSSRRGLTGTLEIAIRCRKNADFSPKPEFVEEIEDGGDTTADNPLRVYSDESLFQEVVRRYGDDLSRRGLDAVQLITRFVTAVEQERADEAQRTYQELKTFVSREHE